MTEELGVSALPPEPLPAPAADARGSISLMFDPIFGPFFWGKFLSSAGNWIHNIVAAIVAFEVTGSTLVVGLVSVVQFAPQILLSPLSGRMSDRGNPLRQIIVGRFLTASGSLLLSVWIWLAGGVGHLDGAGPVIVSSFIVGLGFVIGAPATQSIISSLVRPDELAAAVTLNNVPMIAGRAAGPAMGALVATQLGPTAAFAIAGAGSVAFGVLVLALRLPEPAPASREADLRVVTSLRYVIADRPTLLLLAGIAAVGVGADPSLTLAPALSAQLDGGNGFVGALASAFGIGAAVGFVGLMPLRHWFGMVSLARSGLGLMSAGLVPLIFLESQHLALVSMAVCGIGMTLALTSVTVQIQTRAPQQLRGRIMAWWLVAFLGSRPIAASVNGLLTDTVSLDAALIATVVVVAVVALLCRPSQLERPAPAGG